MKQLTLLFLVKGDGVLLAMKKRGFGEGRWNGVGGKIEEDESIEQGMIRECQEEIHVTPLNYERRAVLLFDEHHNETPTKMQVHVFICDEWEGQPKESEEMRPEWFPKNKLPLKHMWPDDRFWLKHFLEGKLIKAEFQLNENDEIVNKTVELQEYIHA